MRGVRAGRLKDYLGIQESTQTSGEYGGVEDTWTTIKNRACEIRPLRAAEFFRAGGENVEVVYEIRFRYEEGLITESNRLIDTTRSPNRYFDVEGIVNTGNWDSEIVITATERRWPPRD
jgi:head-tail adaptor